MSDSKLQDLPKTMRALAVPEFGKPSTYQIMDVPIPTIEDPNDVLIKVHAAGVSTGDTQLASGMMKMLTGDVPKPIILGKSVSGIVVAVGSQVLSSRSPVRPGEAVYGFSWTRPFNFSQPGTASEYTVIPSSLILPKPPNVSHEDAAAILPSVVTAYQSIVRGLELLRENNHDIPPFPSSSDSSSETTPLPLKGKTVFVPGALSTTGSVGIQLLRNVFGATTIISTVSTAKMPLVEKYLSTNTNEDKNKNKENKKMVDVLIDYTKHPKTLTTAIPRGSVDFAYNTQWVLPKVIPLVDPKRGAVSNIVGMPRKKIFRDEVMPPEVRGKFWIFWVVDLAWLWFAWLLLGTNIKFDSISGNMGARGDLETAGRIIAEEKVRAVVNLTMLDDLDAMREAGERVFTGKGGVGAWVVKVI